MQHCPHCNKKVSLAELPYQGMFENYKKCPYCRGRFIVDEKTRRRQILFLLMAVGSLALTVLLYLQGTRWLFPAIVSYLMLGIYLYWANKGVRLVQYKKDDDKKAT